MVLSVYTLDLAGFMDWWQHKGRAAPAVLHQKKYDFDKIREMRLFPNQLRGKRQMVG